MSKLVAFVALPNSKTGSKDVHRTGQVRVVRTPLALGPLKSYSLQELGKYRMRELLTQLGLEEDAKNADENDLLALLEEFFYLENKHMTRQETMLAWMETNPLPKSDRVLFIGPQENVRQAILLHAADVKPSCQLW